MNFFLNILIAAFLGGAIGLEREYRAKEAGFRTHFLVALGAALFMILSAHGFDGVLTTENHRLDVSRIAAQVVSGIGFIGAGTIIFQKHMVRGLTTAAGLWVTAAIGMTAGAGLYLLATATTVLVLLGLEALNYILRYVGHRHVSVSLTSASREHVHDVLEGLKRDGVDIVSYAMTERGTPEKPAYQVRMELRTTRKRYGERILELMTLFDGVNIESIE